MNRQFKNSLKSFSLEFVLYAALVAGYYFLVLHFLGAWLWRLFQTERRSYAFIALVLIVGQGLLLELLTRLLLAWLKPRAED